MSKEHHVMILNDFKPMVGHARLTHYNIGNKDFIRIRPAGRLRGGAQPSDTDTEEEIEAHRIDEQWGTDLLAHIAESMEKVEYESLKVQAEWGPLPPCQFHQWFNTHYDVSQYYRLCYSRQNGTIRAITVGPKHDGTVMAVLRYFTMSHVWAVTVQDTGKESLDWRWEEEVETPEEARDILLATVPRQPKAHKLLDTILQIRTKLGK